MTTAQLCLVTLCAALVSIDAIVPGAPATAQICEGDCNGNQSVAIDEIILGVRAALGGVSVDECRTIDADGNGAVAVNELVAAVTRALQGCDGPGPSSGTPTSTGVVPTKTPIAPPSTPGPTIDVAALTASARVANDSIFRFLDLQASLGAAANVAAGASAATGGSAGVSGCQLFNCSTFGQVSGTREDCCSGNQFTQLFSNCTFDDDLGRIVNLDGLFVLASDTIDVCSGTIPVGVSFTASLSNFTHDVTFPDQSFFHTFQELSETFEVTPVGCTTAIPPHPSGFGIRGDGRRFIDGELQQFAGDARGNILVDITSEVHGFAIAAGSTPQREGCTLGATLNGSLTSTDFRAGRQFTTNFRDFHVDELPRAGALFLELKGIVGTDCLGDMTVSTIEPLRVVSGDECFTAGRLVAERGNETASVFYRESTRVDFDFGADGSIDQQFTSCTDVPADQCSTSLVGLCGACTALNQCQAGLGCFPCSRDCSDNTRRCALADTFVPCEDGVF